jgi:hypothetical protein
MRDKGLVFEEMRRQRRALASTRIEEWVLWVVVVAVLYVVVSFASRAARHGREPSALGGPAIQAVHGMDGRTQGETRASRGGR